MNQAPIGIAGAGLSGAVIARCLAEHGARRVEVFEARGHIAGNCHTERDEATGVMVHVYGAHVFHTSRQDVWEYVNRFASFRPFITEIKAVTERGVFPLPVNLNTLEQFFERTLSPEEAKALLNELADEGITEPKSFEEAALSMIGVELYEAFFRGYTEKQWGVSPKRLPASILKRLPVRFTANNNYFNDTYQGIPEEGYTAMVAAMLDHPNITVHLNTPLRPEARERFEHVFYCGPLDGFFGHRLGRLRYRSLRFERVEAEGQLQDGPVYNYPDPAVPYTRIFEYKHFTPWESHPRTVAFRQYPMAAGPDDEPYYPMRLIDDRRLLDAYVALADETEGVTFVGRLGTYRYIDMHVAVGEALDVAGAYLDHAHQATPFRVFSRRPDAAPVEQG